MGILNQNFGDIVENKTNFIYSDLLSKIYYEGEILSTRNAETYSHVFLPQTIFNTFPLVTTRKTAIKLALQEMEWFMSGEEKCPEKLIPWWKHQLHMYNYYLDGYPKQFRYFVYEDPMGDTDKFDQIYFLLHEIKSHPNSRRLILTAWNPGEMAYITESNNNPNTPTTCHSTLVQFFVRNNTLHMTSYQRSADMLLGVPHNWVQSWALLIYFAYWTKNKVGTLRWIFGDAHVYKEPSHCDTLLQYLNTEPKKHDVDLYYSPENWDVQKVKPFLASDFYTQGNIPEPTILTKPKLL